ncbi:MAG: hypothetical protein ACYTEU_00290 [Planctomycetota bacterium]|jgi:hypothetical protein
MSNNEKQVNDRENAGNTQPCCDGGSCCPSDSGGSGKSLKMVVFILIVIAAGVVLARSFISKSNPDVTQSQQAFASIQTDNGPDTYPLPKAAGKTELSVESEIKTETSPVVVDTKKQDASVEAASSLWKADLDSLASLNKEAADVDAVFVLLAAKDQQNDPVVTKEIEAAAQKIMANGTKVSAFRLKESAPEYANLAKQVAVPSVLTMVKGLGMSAVSKDITEAKLVQAFVTASRPSSCGPSGCGPTGCEPTPAKPGPRI